MMELRLSNSFWYECRSHRDCLIDDSIPRIICDDAVGDDFPDDPSRNRGPHFNDKDGGHYAGLAQSRMSVAVVSLDLSWVGGCLGRRASSVMCVVW
jgi:hypothetical protein